MIQNIPIEKNEQQDGMNEYFETWQQNNSQSNTMEEAQLLENFQEPNFASITEIAKPRTEKNTNK